MPERMERQGGGGGPRSVCFLSTGFGFGGAEVQIASLARGLRARGWKVHLVSLIPPHEIGEQLRADGFEVHSLEMSRGVPDPRALVKLGRLLRRLRPDVLHCHMVHANLLGRVARLFVRVPVVISTAHSIDEGGRAREWAYRLTDRLTDLTTNVSEAAVRRYIRVKAAPAHRIRWIPNGVDTARFSPDPRARGRLRRELGLGDAFAWLAVGRLEPPKDYPTLLRAFTRVAGGGAKLLIVGTGTLEASCAALARQLELTSSVTFLGRRTDVPAIMSACDGYVMSSAWEGLPMVLLEAGAAGLPLVSTDVGGNGEVVQDGINGFLCPSGDHEELGRRMARMIALSPAERRHMGGASRDWVLARYGMDAVLTRWEAIYAELFDRAALPARALRNPA